MIDINELRRLALDGDLAAMQEIILRLEAAEKSDAESLAMYRKARDERDALRAAVRHEADCVEAAKAEIDALRAKIEQMEQQVPICRAEDLKHAESLLPTLGLKPENPLYALPGAQPTPSVPEGVSFIDTSSLEGVVSTEIVHSYPPPSGWLRAVDEALVVTHLGVANAGDTYEQAKAKLDSLIGFHVDVATDPAVNGGWKLVTIEPTEEMYNAGANHCDGYWSTAQAVLDAMLAAAPEAKS